MHVLTAAKHLVRTTTFFVTWIFLFRPKTAMEWTRRHDILLGREMLAVNPFKAKRKTTQRTKMWELIVQHLESSESPVFKVTVRSVRDRYTLISKKYRKKMSAQLKASGISPEEQELDKLLEELTELEDLSEQEKEESEEKVKKAEEEQEKAKDVRKKAMEKLAETKKRKQKADDENTKKKSRKTPSETIQYLRDKSESELELRRQELELKTKQLDEEKRKQEESNNRDDMLMRMIIEQNKAMMEMMSKLHTK